MPNRKKFGVKNCEVTVYANGEIFCFPEIISVLNCENLIGMCRLYYNDGEESICSKGANRKTAITVGELEAATHSKQIHLAYFIS
jgi:hypothetical protein